jgi:AcrR family transcriptional regulator
MREKNEKGIATRDRIIATARRLFAASGYEETSTDAVLSESGVSRGALYHHFKNKQALFESVLEAVETDVAAKTANAARGIADPVESLRAGFDAFLELARDQEVRQIVLIDAHSVVGWEKWREIDERHGFGGLKKGLRKIAATGRLREEMVEMFAHMLLATLIEVAFLIARAPDPEVAARDGRKAMNELLDRLIGSAVG